MPKGKYKRKKKDSTASKAEIEFCTKCSLPDCIVKENGECRLLNEKFKKR